MADGLASKIVEIASPNTPGRLNDSAIPAMKSKNPKALTLFSPNGGLGFAANKSGHGLLL